MRYTYNHRIDGPRSGVCHVTGQDHHPSGTGTSSTYGPIVTIPGTKLQKGASALYLVFEHVSFDERSDTVLEAAAVRHEHAHSLATLESPALGYSYGLTDRLMVSARFHMWSELASARRVYEHEGDEVENEAVDRGDTEGIGDLSLFGQYRFYGQAAGLQASLLAGIKTPTGETGERDDQGELSRRSFSLARVPGIPCLGLPCRKLRSRWSLDGNILYTVATEGTQHTDLGDRFHYNGAVTYRLKGGNAEASHEVGMFSFSPPRS